MKKISTLFSVLLLTMVSANTFAQTVYASLGSGAWNSGTEWETYPTLAAAIAGSPGSGTASSSTTNPSGTHFVLIRAGHTVTMGDANRGCKGIVIQAGGKLWGSGNLADRRLQIGSGGTGFTYPLVDTIQVDGALGGANDPMYIETGVNAQQVKIFGTGSIDIKRIRTIGAAAGPLTFDINADVNLWQAANYALTLLYNPSAADVYTMNIFAGKTVSVKAVDAYFNNNSVGSGTGFGTYTYNINGTLDLTASTQTATNLSAISPTAGTINLNINAGGNIKTGLAFNSSPVAPGVANITVAAGVSVDAKLATVMNFNGGAFIMAGGSASVARTVQGDGTRINFPLVTAANGSNEAIISRLNSSGTTAIYAAGIQNTFTNPPADVNKVVNKQWNITITGTPSSADTVRLSWLTADQAAGFDPAGTVSVMHWTGSAWEYKTASVSGTGVVGDPYVARASGFTSYSPFGVTSFNPIPLTLLSFNGSYDGKTVNLAWKTTNEINSKNFEIERSSDARNFSSIGTVNAYNSQATNNYSFADAQPLVGSSFYRLKIVDRDGKFKYSNVVSINTKLKGGLTVYPNPTTDNITVSHSKASANTTLNVLTVSGKKVSSITVSKDAVQTSVDVSTLPAGNYVIVINNAGERSSVKFVKE